jgi:hypothetical protein
MMTIAYILLSSIFIAFSNLCIRKSIDAEQSAGDPYLLYRLLISGIVTGLFAFFYSTAFSFNPLMILLGTIAGVLLGLLMWLTGRALKHGSPGLSFAIINGACVMPPLIMALFFGAAYGHEITLRHVIGALCVMIGLFWASWERSSINVMWLFLISSTFFVHTLYLTFFQWRALTLNPNLPPNTLIPFHTNPASADTFVLVMYITAGLLQYILPSSHRTMITAPWSFIAFGVIGGIVNGFGGFAMIKATEIASYSWEKALIFPLYVVCLILLCNIWASILYREKINWYANLVCFVGILIGAS